jgi:hypothetical protein
MLAHLSTDRALKKTIHLDAGILAAIKNEASLVNFD